MDAMAEIERLKALMLKKVYFVMRRRIVAPEKLGPVMLDHYNWIIGLEKAGQVFASGPVSTRDGKPGVGMTIFRAADWDAAEAMAAADPFVLCGAADFTIEQWQLNEGRVTMSYDMSDQTTRFD